MTNKNTTHETARYWLCFVTLNMVNSHSPWIEKKFLLWRENTDKVPSNSWDLMWIAAAISCLVYVNLARDRTGKFFIGIEMLQLKLSVLGNHLLQHHAFLCPDYAAVIMTQIMKVAAGTAETTTTLFFLPQKYLKASSGEKGIKLNI